MKLREWLFKTRISVKDFSKLLGINRSYMHTIMNGSQIPSQRILDRIKDVTIGQVSKIEELSEKQG